MSFTNNMTRLINKIERRLGTAPLNLPEHLKKDKWDAVIREDSLPTFSRFFPREFQYRINVARDKYKNGFYYIDEDYIGAETKILGVRDLDFDTFGTNNSQVANSFAYVDPYQTYFSYDDIAIAQMSANQGGLFNRGLYVEFQEPNRIAVKSSANKDMVQSLREFDVLLLLEHPDNLATIAPTKMESFEKLALLDIQVWLYNELKHYNNLETVFANIDLKIDDWSSCLSDRESLVEKFTDAYVSAANTSQPMILSF